MANPCAYCGAPLRRPPLFELVRVRVYDGRYGGPPVFNEERVPTIDAYCDDVVCPKCNERNWPDFGQVDPPPATVHGFASPVPEPAP